MRTRHRCECGRKALCLPRYGKRRSRKVKAGNPTVIKGHPYCVGCWEKFNDSMKGMK